jgi:hypothetical protein
MMREIFWYVTSYLTKFGAYNGYSFINNSEIWDIQCIKTVRLAAELTVVKQKLDPLGMTSLERLEEAGTTFQTRRTQEHGTPQGRDLPNWILLSKKWAWYF